MERDRSPINREHDHLAQYRYSITEPTKSDGFDSDQARAIRRCGSALPEGLHHSWPARVPWPSSSCEKRPGFQTAGEPLPPPRHRPPYVLSRAPPDALGLGFHVEAAVERAHALLQRRLFTLILFVVEPLFLDRCRRRGCRRSAGRARPGPELPMAHEALNVITILLGAIAGIHGQCARWLDGKAQCCLVRSAPQCRPTFRL